MQLRLLEPSVLAQHTASRSIIGYVYQVQYALINLFGLNEGDSLAIEILDDISIESEAGTQMIQVKYHRDKGRLTLTDKSYELWNTLATWAVAIRTGEIDVGNIHRFLLVTRATPRPEGIAAMLAAKSAPADVVDRLLAVTESRNKNLKRAMLAVRSLDYGELIHFVQKIELLHTQASAMVKDNELHKALRRASFHVESLDKASELLTGWLWKRIVVAFDQEDGLVITEQQFHDALAATRDAIDPRSLPLRYNDTSLDDSFDAAHVLGESERNYIRQLVLIGAGPSLKQQAVAWHFRASSERTEWIAKGEALPGELAAFDNELADRWKIGFGKIQDAIAPDTEEDTLRKMGMNSYNEIQDQEISFRGTVKAYLVVGSYHTLADTLKVGWHPRYRMLLTKSP